MVENANWNEQFWRNKTIHNKAKFIHYLKNSSVGNPRTLILGGIQFAVASTFAITTDSTSANLLPVKVRISYQATEQVIFLSLVVGLLLLDCWSIVPYCSLWKYEEAIKQANKCLSCRVVTIRVLINGTLSLPF